MSTLVVGTLVIDRMFFGELTPISKIVVMPRIRINMSLPEGQYPLDDSEKYN